MTRMILCTMCLIAVVVMFVAPNTWSGIRWSDMNHKGLVTTMPSGGDPALEVATLLLLGSGFIGLGWFVRKKLAKKP